MKYFILYSQWFSIYFYYNVGFVVPWTAYIALLRDLLGSGLDPLTHIENGLRDGKRNKRIQLWNTSGTYVFCN